MRAVTLDDYKQMARRRLPRFLFDFIEGGVEEEWALQRNVQALRWRPLLPKACVDVTHRNQAVTLLGKTYASPFGVGPAGTCELYRRNGDLMIARAAAAANVPYCMSGASHALLEAAARAAGSNFWFQLYPAKDPAITEDLIRRAAAAGATTLVVTIDTPVNPRRMRALRNGITIPLKPTVRLLTRLLADGVTHPEWAWDYVRHGGMPMMKTWQRYAPAGAGPSEVAAFYRRQSPCVITWKDLEHFRRLWHGNLVIKGILRISDAVRCRDIGADALIISNHGGKVLDLLPPSAEVLPQIRQAVGHEFALILDGGIQTGSDVIAALCLGADMVFLGRAPLFSMAAGGEAGVSGMLALLREEVDVAMALLGAADVAAFDDSFLASAEPSDAQAVSVTPFRRVKQ